MKYTIRGKGIEITDAMKQKTISVFSKLEKYNNMIGTENNFQIEVSYFKEKIAIIDATLNLIKNNIVLKCRAQDPDFYRALDKAVKEMKSQIIKNKDRKVTAHKRQTGTTGSMKKNVDAFDDISEDSEE